MVPPPCLPARLAGLSRLLLQSLPSSVLSLVSSCGVDDQLHVPEVRGITAASLGRCKIRGLFDNSTNSYVPYPYISPIRVVWGQPSRVESSRCGLIRRSSCWASLPVRTSHIPARSESPPIAHISSSIIFKVDQTHIGRYKCDCASHNLGRTPQNSKRTNKKVPQRDGGLSGEGRSHETITFIH